MADYEIKGFKELMEAMKQLPKVIEEKCLKVSVMTGALVIKKAASELAVKRTGLTGKAVRIGFNKKESGPGKKVYHVFVSRKFQMLYPWGKEKGRTDHYGGKKIDAFWWHILEFGSVKMSAKPFMRPAFDAMAGDAANRIKEKLAQRIEIEAARLGSK